MIDGGEYIDDVNGGTLNREDVTQARKLELDWLRKREVFEIVPAKICKTRPLSLRWVDTKKTDGT
eukprot:8312590-Prorocentrum_lima.AAC.1